jgi:hypothetical protein
LTNLGGPRELQRALDWLRSQPYKRKLIIGGNHDLLLDPAVQPRDKRDEASFESLRWSGLTYLNGESITIEVSGRKLKVYGSPWMPRQGNWAFRYPRDLDVGITECQMTLIFSSPTGHRNTI